MYHGRLSFVYFILEYCHWSWGYKPTPSGRNMQSSDFQPNWGWKLMSLTELTHRVGKYRTATHQQVSGGDWSVCWVEKAHLKWCRRSLLPWRQLPDQSLAPLPLHPGHLSRALEEEVWRNGKAKLGFWRLGFLSRFLKRMRAALSGLLGILLSTPLWAREEGSLLGILLSTSSWAREEESDGKEDRVFVYSRCTDCSR